MGVTVSATAPFRLPDEPELATAVARALNRDRGSVSILRRRENVHTSTWPSEIVDCRVGCDREMRLLVKHGPRGIRNAHGHPVGPEYEAAVYETVLREVDRAHPFLGSPHDPGSESSCIVLEHLGEGWWRLNRDEDPRAIVRVATWLGAFHADAAARAEPLPAP